MVRITKKSILTGKFNTMELDVSKDQLNRYESGELVQNVFPELSADEREFLISGITPEEWNKAFGEEV